jgi:hypothetical protein
LELPPFQFGYCLKLCSKAQMHHNPDKKKKIVKTKGFKDLWGENLGSHKKIEDTYPNKTIMEMHS